MNAVADGFAVFFAAMRAGIALDPPLLVDEWSDKHMRIPRGASAHPGKYSSTLTPYAREPMRCLSPTYPAKRIVMKAASQITKTQIGINFLMAVAREAPANVLVLMPSDGLAKRLSNRVSKTIQCMQIMRDVFAEPRSRDARNTIDTKEFDGGIMYIVTSRSAANLAEIPARYVYADEVDRWITDVDGEGDPIKLAEARVSSYGKKAKLYYSSSPGEEEESVIERLFMQGDQRHFYVPCPECGHMQTLEFEQMHWTDDFGDVWHECVNCKKPIQEMHKAAMYAAGEWRPHAKGDGETVSFTISAAYAPAGGYSWATMAREFVAAKELQQRAAHEAMQAFFNTRLARVWSLAHDKSDGTALEKRAEGYPLRQCQQGVLLVTAAVDVQHDRLEIMVVGWGRDEESWIVDRTALTGDPALSEVWTKLDDYLMTTFPHANGQKLRIEACAVDTGGHHTHEVYNFCRVRQSRRVFAIKGQDKPGGPVKGRCAAQDVNDRGRLIKRGVKLWFVGINTAKDVLHNRLQLDHPGPGYIHFSKQLTSEFYREMTAEKRVQRRTSKGLRYIWHNPPGVRNESWDLAVYNLFCAHALDLHRYTDTLWARRETALLPSEDAPPVAAPAIEKPAIKPMGTRFMPVPATVRQA